MYEVINERECERSLSVAAGGDDQICCDGSEIGIPVLSLLQISRVIRQPFGVWFPSNWECTSNGVDVYLPFTCMPGDICGGRIKTLLLCL